MTTIALKDNILACDTQITADDVKYNCSSKITIVRNDLVIAGSGDSNEILKLEKFFREFPDWEENLDKKPKIRASVDCILISKGKPYTIYKDGFPDPMGHPFIASGSGWKFAMAGMHLGLSAVDAVKLASEFDVYTNDRIRYINVAELQGSTKETPKRKRAPSVSKEKARTGD